MYNNNILDLFVGFVHYPSKMNLETAFNFNDFSREELILDFSGTVQMDSTLADIPILDEESVLVCLIICALDYFSVL